MDNDDEPFFSPEAIELSDNTDLIRESLKTFKDIKRFSDIQVLCGSNKYFCHKIVLATQSVFFNGALEQEGGDEAVQELHIEENPHIWQLCLEYLYSGKVQVPPPLLTEVIELAEKLQIKQLYLLAKSAHYRDVTVTSENCLEVFCAVRLLQDNALTEKSHPLALQNLTKLIRHLIFHNICSQCLEVLLTDENLNVSTPEQRLALALEWINKDTEARQQHLQDILQVLPVSYMNMSIVAPYLHLTVFSNKPECLRYIQQELAKQNPDSEESGTQEEPALKDPIFLTPLRLNLPFKPPWYAVVATLEIGRDTSSDAYSLRKQTNDICLSKSWAYAFGIQSFKTPTVVMVSKEDNQLVEFGYQALAKYSELDEDDVDKYSLFDNLWTAFNTDCLSLKSKNGKQVQAEVIFSHVLQYLSNRVLDNLEKLDTSCSRFEIKESVRWVLTVPASIENTLFIRKAAQQTGLTNDETSSSLILVSEAEAALYFCLNFPCDEETGLLQGMGLKRGDTCIIVDCKFSSLDVTVLQLQGELIQHFHQSIAKVGGSQVDQNFEQLLSEVFGAAVMEAFKGEEEREYLELLVKFDCRKRSFDQKEKEFLNIPLSFAFKVICENMAGKDLKATISPQWKEKGVSCGKGFLRLSKTVIIGLFTPVVNALLKDVNRIIQKIPSANSATHLIVIGDFAECQVLRTAICDEFDGQLKVICPKDPSCCVVKGATIYGHHFENIKKVHAMK